jgi:hypothetical protein
MADKIKRRPAKVKEGTMRKVIAFLFVAIFASMAFSQVDSLSVVDTNISVSQQIIPAHIDSILPFGAGKTIYIPATYNRTDAFIFNAWRPDSNKIKQWAKLLAKNSAFRLPLNQKCVYRVKIQAFRMDTSFICPDPYLP